MTNGLTIGRIDLAPLTRFSIGFDEVFEQLARTHEQLSNTQMNYPPYNIIKYGPNQFAIEIAVAGFDLEEIDISVEDNNLTVAGEKSANTEEFTYVHKGISTRSFKRTWPLGEHVEVKDAVIKNGMLTVKLERIVPDSMKPRKVAITSAK
jgi:molecular chaperone IbpA